MQVKAEVGLKSVAYRLENLSFRGLQESRVPIDIDPLGIAPLESLRPVRVQHGYHMDRRSGRDALSQSMIRPFIEEANDVGQRHRRRTLVSVHLGPQKYGCGAGTEGQVTNLTTLSAQPREAFSYGPAQVGSHSPPVLRVVGSSVVEIGHPHHSVKVDELVGAHDGQRGNWPLGRAHRSISDARAEPDHHHHGVSGHYSRCTRQREPEACREWVIRN